MKTYLEKNIEAINSALFKSVGSNTRVVHETENGTIIVMRGLRTTGDDFFSKNKNTGGFTLIGPNDKIYVEDIA